MIDEQIGWPEPIHEWEISFDEEKQPALFRWLRIPLKFTRRHTYTKWTTESNAREAFDTARKEFPMWNWKLRRLEGDGITIHGGREISDRT